MIMADDVRDLLSIDWSFGSVVNLLSVIFSSRHLWSLMKKTEQPTEPRIYIATVERRQPEY
jgi:hypothetical protein